MIRKQNIINTFLILEQNPVLNSIRQGFIIMMPVFLTGAFALMLLNFPIPIINNYIHTLWNGRIPYFLNTIYESSFGLASIFLLITVSHSYSSNITRKPGVLNILSCLVAIASYIALLGNKPEVLTDNGSIKVILLTGLNVQGIFAALICSILSTRIFLFFVKKFTFVSSYTQFSINADYRTALQSLYAMLLTISIFALSSLSVVHIFNVDNINELMMMLLDSHFERVGVSIWSGLLVFFIQSLLWFFGIHGSNVLESVSLSFFSGVQEEIINKTFFDVFAFIGGSGSSLSLLIAVFLFSKQKVQRSLGRFALAPMLFNINEIFIYGLPIVLNPLMLIPFILTPMIALSVSYLSVVSGLVPEIVRSVPWTTPVLISGYLATDSVIGVILQIVIISIGVLIYAPFVKLGNNLHDLKADNLINEMSGLVCEALDKGSKPELFTGNDLLSKAAKELALELRRSIERKEIELHYQPQHDNSGRVVSCEALLRWRFQNRKYIIPPLVLEISKEDESFSRLTDCIIEKAIYDTRIINREFGNRISVSINIDSAQLNNLDFINRLTDSVSHAGILDNTFGIEITEESELKDSGQLDQVFSLLHDNGIKLAIDDFSTGHTSLVYLQNNKFDFVKLDGSLVRNLLANDRSLDIIKSITNLGESLGFEVIAEYVENEEQKSILKSIGCSKYQGYLYSPPLKREDFIEYVHNDLSKEHPQNSLNG